MKTIYLVYICTMKELTRAEEQVMQILWRLEKGFVKEIVEEFDDPKPAYNTVSTIVRILETKGFVDHQSFGKSHQYYPLVSRDEYRSSSLKHLTRNYFGNSFRQLVSFFTDRHDVPVDELEEMLRLMEKEVERRKAR